jgi:lysyl-tRNA synthetase class 2
MDLEMLKERARIIRRVRSFFDDKGYLELDTPLLSPDLIPESCLEVFETSRIVPNGKTVPNWLIPSPEIWMKKIIARHQVSVYQICKCFRNGESSGFLHSPEFTMLEYYSMGVGYRESLALTEELFDFLLDSGSGEWGVGSGGTNKAPRQGAFTDNVSIVPAREKSTVPENGKPPSGGCVRRGWGDSNTALGDGGISEPSTLLPPFERLTVAEVFARFAGFDLFAAAETVESMEREARRLGLDPMPGLGIAQLYDLIFIHAVEPRLKTYGSSQEPRPIALLDYPAFVPCLARRNADGKTVERWELYFNGIELANCFSEETDAGRVKEFFESEAAAKEQDALVKHHVDKDYWKMFAEKGFPQCSGVAMGLDRLIMALCGRSTIDGVLPFPES